MIPVDLSKLSNALTNDDAKKTVYDELVTKVKATDTGRFVLKTQNNTDTSSLQKKIDDADKKYLTLVDL